MKKKIFIAIAALFGVAALVFAWAVETSVSFGCPSCGNIIVVNIRSNADQGTELGGCPNCNKHYIMTWKATGNGGVMVTSVKKQ